jgi:hypothetical protein
MNDQQLEAVLQRYQVGEPPAGLRARVLDGRAVDRRVRLGAVDLALAAAAAVLLISWAATATPSLTAQQIAAAQAARHEAVEQLAAELGAGEQSRRVAELAVPPVLPVWLVGRLPGLEDPW